MLHAGLLLDGSGRRAGSARREGRGLLRFGPRGEAGQGRGWFVLFRWFLL
jgi:hypothetical protein